MKLDWQAMRRSGLTQLGLTPREFWDLTPLELSIMLGLETASRPMLSESLRELMQAHPDRAHKEGHRG